MAIPLLDSHCHSFILKTVLRPCSFVLFGDTVARMFLKHADVPEPCQHPSGRLRLAVANVAKLAGMNFEWAGSKKFPAGKNAPAITQTDFPCPLALPARGRTAKFLPSSRPCCGTRKTGLHRAGNNSTSARRAPLAAICSRASHHATAAIFFRITSGLDQLVLRLRFR